MGQMFGFWVHYQFQSTPPVREETEHTATRVAYRIFQSTPPVREETLCGNVPLDPRHISIHSSRAGGDDTCARPFRWPSDFNPLLPCGRRL